ncbi:MAG: hypothetical protein FGM35_04255 [Rhodocyclaceae bacterium]|nr:hypothetical protein [Rhodocyclaceae bacterium]
MEEIINALKEMHKEIKSERPKSSKLNGNSAYKNGFEDGHKLVTKRLKAFIEGITAQTEAGSPKTVPGTNNA